MPSEHHRFGPPEAYGQPPRTGRFWFDLLAATAAIVISVVSVVIALRGERTQRGLLSANAWPFAEVSVGIGTDFESVEVENQGVGPAKLVTFAAYLNGKPVADGMDLLRRCCGVTATTATPNTARTPADRGIGIGEIAHNVIRPGERLIWLKIHREPGNDATFDALSATLPHLRFRACYCSVLDDCWASTMQTVYPTAVATCPMH